MNKEFEKIGYIMGNGTTTEPRAYSFTDVDVAAGEYIYRLKQIDYDGTFEYSNEVEVSVSLPEEFSLSQNYPNPFNPSTIISYSIPQSGLVTLEVYSLLGEKVASLVNEVKEAGSYEINFNASTLSSGVYYYKLSTDNFVETKKMLLLR